MRVPWKPWSQGRHVNSTIAELVDLYTFAELSGLPPPEAGVKGKSLAGALDALRDNSSVPLNTSENIAWSMHPRCPVDETHLSDNVCSQDLSRVDMAYI